MVLTLDYFPPDKMPGEGTKYVVCKHLNALIDKIYRDLNEFSLKQNLKQKTMQQLYSLIICAEDRIKPHCESILKNVVYKFILDEDPEMAARSYKIAELMGFYVQTNFLLPMMISHLTDSESKSVPRFVSSGLTAFSAVIHHST